MGTITMVDGSNTWLETGERDSTSRHFADRDRSELDQMLIENATFNGTEVKKIPMEIPKGHMSFHHCRTYHGSGANRSPDPRRAVSLHLQDGANAYRKVTLSDGSTVAYNHDTVVRRIDDRPDYADPDFCPTIWRS
jgi:ectoine hydroxylase-related dioxygenase (phytanoyl-CoA dioxygenase family)